MENQTLFSNDSVVEPLCLKVLDRDATERTNMAAVRGGAILKGKTLNSSLHRITLSLKCIVAWSISQKMPNVEVTSGGLITHMV